MGLADLIVSADNVVTPDGVVPASVVITHGVIEAVAPRDAHAGASERLDVGPLWLMPGLVDTHVHVNEPGRTEWEGFASATKAAAAGGITTIVDMPLNSVPVTTDVVALEAKAAAARGKCWVDYGFWGGVVPGNTGSLDPLLDAGVLGFKCFLVPSGIDEFGWVDEDDLRPATRVLARRDAVLLVHAEAPGPIGRAEGRVEGDPRCYPTYLATRPPEAEVEAIRMMIGLSRETGCRVHVVHLACAEALAIIEEAGSTGVPISVETCPHYLTFCAEDIADGETDLKCAPPIRDRANRDALWRGLGAGTIDLIATDHSPSPPALKATESGDFLAAWGGISSLQLSLPVVWTEARRRGHTLQDLVRWMSEAPARLAGLDGTKGRIAPGCDADLIVFDPEARFTVDGEALYHRHASTPYHGRTMHGLVRRTFVRGIPVLEDGVCLGRPRGRRVVRGS